MPCSPGLVCIYTNSWNHVPGAAVDESCFRASKEWENAEAGVRMWRWSGRGSGGESQWS